MLENISCAYCEHWKHAKIMRRKIEEEFDEVVKKKSKKKKKKIVHGNITKKCSAGSKSRKVEIDSYACKYFNPSRFIYCDNNNCFLDIVVCLNRKRNTKELKDFDNCKKCKQFNSISDIIQDYYLGDTEILKARRKIKRRAKEEPKRIIKRRPKKRKIKRRKKSQRIIKRRIK